MKDCYPLKNEKCIANIRKVENGIYILSAYSVTNKEDYFNYTSSYIFDLCDGEINVEDIVKNMMSEFNVSNEGMVINDVKNILHEMWCRGYITWREDNNPFIKYYEYIVDDYIYCQGNLDLLENYKQGLNGVTYTDIHYNKDVILDENFLYSTYLNGINTLFALKHDGQYMFKMLVNLDSVGRRIYIRHMEFSGISDNVYKIYRNFIEWACKDLIKRNCINSKLNNVCNCIISLDNNEQKNSILNFLGFRLSGVLKKEVYFNEKFHDAHLFINLIR